MQPSSERHWLKHYSASDKAWRPSYGDMLSPFRAAVATGRGGVRYFGAHLTWRDIDTESDRLAGWAAARGVGPGDRIAIILHNVPSFAVAAVAAWKLGAVPTPGNPAFRGAELGRIFADCAPTLVICHVDQTTPVQEALGALGVSCPVLTVARGDHAGADWPGSHFSQDDEAPGSLMAVLRGPQEAYDGHEAAPGDLGLLLYTSGTTGAPKGAMVRHESLAYNSQHVSDWCGLHGGSRVLGIAPLFHITGFVCHLCIGIVRQCDLILLYRFEAQMVLEAIRAERPTFTLGAITAFNALASLPEAGPEAFASFEQIYSGGAPIAPALQSMLRDRLGVSIKNCYGMTETAAPTHLTPLGREAPVDPATNALSVGVPGFGTDSRIIDDEGRALPPGEPGELCMKGPQIMAGYWNKPAETAACLSDGWVRSGDVGFMDADGWFYLVDRKKDMIIASGFKVWPREVEDALYEHPAVREAAVIGEADAYRGETVIGYVSLRPGAVMDPSELIEHARTRLAGYKCPRRIHVIDDLPKTATGKIQRNVLRDALRPKPAA